VREDGGREEGPHEAELHEDQDVREGNSADSRDEARAIMVQLKPADGEAVEEADEYVGDHGEIVTHRRKRLERRVRGVERGTQSKPSSHEEKHRWTQIREKNLRWGDQAVAKSDIQLSGGFGGFGQIFCRGG